MLRLLLNLTFIAAILLGGLASLMMLAGAISGAPNANPKGLRGLRLLMWTILIGGTTAAVGGLYLLTTGHPGYGALLGASPAIVLAVVLVCLTLK
jgi:hypothetical protein